MRADVPCRGRIYRQSHNIFQYLFNTLCGHSCSESADKKCVVFCFLFSTRSCIYVNNSFSTWTGINISCSSPPLRVTTNDEVSKHTSRISRLISSLTRQPVPRYAVKVQYHVFLFLYSVRSRPV